MQIYKTTNKVTGRIYVGKEKNNNPEYIGSGIILKQAIKKYGRENFSKDILQICKDKKEWLQAEKDWIKKLNSRDRLIGYNIALGGDGGKTTEIPWNKGKKLPPLSEEAKKHLSFVFKERYKQVKHPTFGRPSWNKGISLTPKQKEKMKYANLGRIQSEIERKNHSIAMEGKNTYKRTEEHRDKIRKALKGRLLPEDTKKRMSKAKKGDSNCSGPVVTCPICGKVGRNRAMRRWHFDRCKEKLV
jgi:hypothetical protein